MAPRTKPAADTSGDSGSGPQSLQPAGATDLRTPPGDPPTATGIDHEEVHGELMKLEDVLNQNPRASVGFMSFTGSEVMSLPQSVAAVLTDGLYRAEQGVWVIRVYGGKVVSAVKKDVTHAYNEDEVTLQPASDPANTDPSAGDGLETNETDEERAAREAAAFLDT